MTAYAAAFQYQKTFGDHVQGFTSSEGIEPPKYLELRIHLDRHVTCFSWAEAAGALLRKRPAGFVIFTI
jgi:hypothetical protein